MIKKINIYFLFKIVIFLFYVAIPHVKDGKIEALLLIKTGCNIIFHKYEPLDLKSCPYIVMVVKNTHSHPPPPPHRIPGHLQENVKNLIKNSNDLLNDTTPRKLISGIKYLIFFSFYFILFLIIFVFQKRPINKSCFW